MYIIAQLAGLEYEVQSTYCITVCTCIGRKGPRAASLP
jgi:hypothetical protein